MTQLLTLISLNGFASMLMAEAFDPRTSPLISNWTCEENNLIFFHLIEKSKLNTYHSLNLYGTIAHRQVVPKQKDKHDEVVGPFG